MIHGLGEVLAADLSGLWTLKLQMHSPMLSQQVTLFCTLWLQQFPSPRCQENTSDNISTKKAHQKVHMNMYMYMSIESIVCMCMYIYICTYIYVQVCLLVYLLDPSDSQVNRTSWTSLGAVKLLPPIRVIGRACMS